MTNLRDEQGLIRCTILVGQIATGINWLDHLGTFSQTKRKGAFRLTLFIGDSPSSVFGLANLAERFADLKISFCKEQRGQPTMALRGL